MGWHVLGLCTEEGGSVRLSRIAGQVDDGAFDWLSAFGLPKGMIWWHEGAVDEPALRALPALTTPHYNYPTLTEPGVNLILSYLLPLWEEKGVICEQCRLTRCDGIWTGRRRQGKKVQRYRAKLCEQCAATVEEEMGELGEWRAIA
jgi:hypothetical protein